MTFIRTAAYHMQQNKLGLSMAEDDDCDDGAEEMKQKEGTTLEVSCFDEMMQEDAVMNQIKVFQFVYFEF